MFNVHKHAHSRTLILNMRIPQPIAACGLCRGWRGAREVREHTEGSGSGSGHSQPAGRSISYHLKRLPENEGVGKTVLVVPREGTRRHGSRHRRLPRGQRFRPTDRPNDHVGPGPGPRPPPLPPAAVWRRRRGVLSNPSQASPSACGVWSGCVREHPNRTVGFSQRQNVGMSRVRVYVYHY
ncbi:hypothetical protein BJV77DRAFT_266759 [Russula vinacea]|nr:hypothetical protein BJV77DRAFT_266759 [Russula vinacea]